MQEIHEQEQPPSEAPLPAHPHRKGSVWQGVIAVLACLLVVGLGALCYTYYQKLQQTQHQLSEQIVRLQQADARQSVLIHLQNQKFNATERAIQELATHQQSTVSGWVMAEADYLARLAVIHLKFDRNTALAQQLLTAANHRLQSLADPRLMTVQQSLSSDIAKLQAVPTVNSADLVDQLLALDQQLSKLPSQSRIPFSVPGGAAGMAIPAINSAEHLPWHERIRLVWQKLWQGVHDHLQDIIIIRHQPASQQSALLSDTEFGLVIASIHSQLTMAAWAVLHQQPLIYQKSLQQAHDWVTTYYDGQYPEVQHWLSNLQTLQNQNILPDVPDITPSITALEKVMETIPS